MEDVSEHTDMQVSPEYFPLRCFQNSLYAADSEITKKEMNYRTVCTTETKAKSQLHILTTQHNTIHTNMYNTTMGNNEKIITHRIITRTCMKPFCGC